MTLKRIDCTSHEAATLLSALPERERIMDASMVYSAEHPDHGHVIMVLHTNGTATVFADEVRFLQDGSEPASGPMFDDEDRPLASRPLA
jgi:hypothetical protein